MEPRSDNEETLVPAQSRTMLVGTPRNSEWPLRPTVFPELMTPLEAAQYLRLDELGTHTPMAAVRTLKFWRDRGHLRATKYARHVWYRRFELDEFLKVKTETAFR